MKDKILLFKKNNSIKSLYLLLCVLLCTLNKSYATSIDTTYNLSFSTQVLNSYEINSRELAVLVSTDFNGIYDFGNVNSATWTDISSRFTFPLIETGDLTSAGKQDISDLISPGKSLYIAYKYKTVGVPPAARMGRGWRVELFSLKRQSDGDTVVFADQTNPGGTMMSKGSVDAGGGVIQTIRLAFLPIMLTCL